MAAASARVFLASLKPPPPPPPLHLPPLFTHHLLIRPLLPSLSGAVVYNRRRYPVNCLVSGVDGGGVSDDFVSTRKSGFGSEFNVLANMLKRIEPLDTSVIAKGVSDSAKESMKQTISSMLGLLPSDQFSVTVRFGKRPLDRLIVSSIITGYTLWNAEYRISLMRNFDIPSDNLKRFNSAEENVNLGSKREGIEGGESGVGVNTSSAVSETIDIQTLENLSPEALKYVQQLEEELSSVKQELHSQQQENLKMEYINESNNDLLEYLRSLESDMVTELSRPSSFEVEEIIKELTQNILQIFFKEDEVNKEEDPNFSGVKNCQSSDAELCDTIGTSRDYLAKLLFWCMLLGHHLRGLENRLHLSCVVGLL
ncbi:putative F-box protein-like [Capsicum annuum]|uniref:uncharacterized protein LOC107860588 n=1 Tax=Capsicum annuum TaxID=4072 RepID=UPI001FB18555|nr:uncharacterized protein LOC107860588 [Capsicum annuum]KAF3622531.1 putative F-box protein-like [Capsicum annuum]